MSGGGNGVRVLVVDDDPQILRALRINLTAHGYTVRIRGVEPPRQSSSTGAHAPALADR